MRLRGRVRGGEGAGGRRGRQAGQGVMRVAGCQGAARLICQGAPSRHTLNYAQGEEGGGIRGDLHGLMFDIQAPSPLS